LLDTFANRRQLDEDDVAKLLLRMIGDADCCDIAIEPNVFMILGVANVGH
jgi:hypothetical protein